MTAVPESVLVQVLSTLSTREALSVVERIDAVAEAINPEFLQEMWKLKVMQKFDLRVFPEEIDVDWRLVYMVLDKKGLEDCLDVIYEMQVPEVMVLIQENPHLPVKFLPSITRSIADNQLDTLKYLVEDSRARAEITTATNWYPLSLAVTSHDNPELRQFLVESGIVQPADLAQALEIAEEQNRVESYKQLSQMLGEVSKTITATMDSTWKTLYDIQDLAASVTTA
jgi:hypothetical protein